MIPTKEGSKVSHGFFWRGSKRKNACVSGFERIKLWFDMLSIQEEQTNSEAISKPQ